MNIDPKKEIRLLPLEKELKVNAYDIDVMGIVHNVVYVRWFEDLRTHFLDTYIPLTDILREGKCPFLVKTEIEYLSPLDISHKPVGKVWMESVRKIKWTAGFEIISSEGTHCRGKQTGAFMTLKTRRICAAPEAFQILFR